MNQLIPRFIKEYDAATQRYVKGEELGDSDEDSDKIDTDNTEKIMGSELFDYISLENFVEKYKNILGREDFEAIASEGQTEFYQNKIIADKIKNYTEEEREFFTLQLQIHYKKIQIATKIFNELQKNAFEKLKDLDDPRFQNFENKIQKTEISKGDLKGRKYIEIRDDLEAELIYLLRKKRNFMLFLYQKYGLIYKDEYENLNYGNTLWDTKLKNNKDEEGEEGEEDEEDEEQKMNEFIVPDDESERNKYLRLTQGEKNEHEKENTIHSLKNIANNIYEYNNTDNVKDKNLLYIKSKKILNLVLQSIDQKAADEDKTSNSYFNKQVQQYNNSGDFYVDEKIRSNFQNLINLILKYYEEKKNNKATKIKIKTLFERISKVKIPATRKGIQLIRIGGPPPLGPHYVQRLEAPQSGPYDAKRQREEESGSSSSGEAPSKKQRVEKEMQDLDKDFEDKINELIKKNKISADDFNAILEYWEFEKTRFNTKEDLIEVGNTIIYNYKNSHKFTQNKNNFKLIKRGIFENLQKEIHDLIINKKISQTDGQEIIKAWKDGVKKCETYEKIEILYNKIINDFKQNFKNKKIEKEKNRRIVHDQLSKELEKLGIPYDIIFKKLNKFNKQQENKNTIEELLKLKENLLEKYIQNQKKERNELENIFFENLQIVVENNPNKNYILEFWKDNEQNCITIDDFKNLYNLSSNP